jgi:hypothetical protein
MKTSKTLKWVSGGIECFLAIPFLGGFVILSMLWIPLGVMFVLHLITLIFCSNENEGKAGSILGIITSVVGWFPILGWIMHLATAITLMVSAAQKEPHQDPFAPDPRYF